MEHSVAQILRSPRARRIVDQAARALEDEATRRQEFLDWVSPSDKAEFINGEVIVHSPARASHNRVSLRLTRLLADYVDEHDLGLVGIEKWMVSLTRNDYEPDVCFWRSEVADTFESDQMRFPAPDLVCEVLSPSTRGNDLGVKLDDYGAHGVMEYWVLDPVDETVRQFVQADGLEDGPALENADLEDGRLELVTLSSTGEVQSRAVPGLVLPVAAFFSDQAFRAARA